MPWPSPLWDITGGNEVSNYLSIYIPGYYCSKGGSQNHPRLYGEFTLQRRNFPDPLTPSLWLPYTKRTDYSDRILVVHTSGIKQIG